MDGTSLDLVTATPPRPASQRPPPLPALPPQLAALPPQLAALPPQLAPQRAAQPEAAPVAQPEAPVAEPILLSPREEAAVARVAARAKLWGFLCVTIGGVQVVASLYARQSAGMISYLPAGAVAILVGLASLSVGQALYAVNRPGGDGVHKLLIAVDAVGVALLVQIVTTVVGVLFAAIAVGLQMIAAQ